MFRYFFSALYDAEGGTGLRQVLATYVLAQNASGADYFSRTWMDSGNLR